MKLPRVKICGLTRHEDVLRAASAGADALGFVHYPPSPRHLTVDSLTTLIQAAPADPWKVLVLVNPERDATEALCETSGASAIQLCGTERPEDWRDFPRPLLRRLGVGPGAGDELEAWTNVAAAFVLDHPAQPGGSGRTVDESLAAALARRATCYLAGGLDSRNVAAIVGRISPYGVDASSGLESRAGIKDPDTLTEFVHAAKAALL